MTQITPEPYAQHSDTLSSPTQGTMGAPPRWSPSPGCMTSVPPLAGWC